MEAISLVPDRSQLQEHATPLYSCHGVSYTDIFLDQISFERDFREKAVTNHKKLIDDTASLDRNCLSLTKEKVC